MKGEPGRRWQLDRAVEGSGLPALTRHLLHTLLRNAKTDTGEIPDRWQPSLATLRKRTGMRQEVLLREMKRAESAGWLVRESPPGGGRGRTNKYRVVIPESGPAPEPFSAGESGSGAGPETVTQKGPHTAATGSESGPVLRVKRSGSGSESGPGAGPRIRSGSDLGSDLSLGSIMGTKLPGLDPDERERFTGWLIRTKNPGSAAAWLTAIPTDHMQRHLANFRGAATTAATTKAARPDWCGRCDERTRMRDNDAGQPSRCPSCHPLVAQAAQ